MMGKAMVEKVVYVIAAGDGIRKIGISASPGFRMGQLEKEVQGPLVVEAVFDCGTLRPRTVEGMAHRRLEGRRVRTANSISREWFDVSLGEAEAAIREAMAEVRQKELDRLPPSRTGKVPVFC